MAKKLNNNTFIIVGAVVLILAITFFMPSFAPRAQQVPPGDEYLGRQALVDCNDPALPETYRYYGYGTNDGTTCVSGIGSICLHEAGKCDSYWSGEGQFLGIPRVFFPDCTGISYGTYKYENSADALAACLASMPCDMDGICDAGESRTTCADDCGQTIDCDLDGTCDAGEAIWNCKEDCIGCTGGDYDCPPTNYIPPTRTAKSITVSELQSLAPTLNNYLDYVCGKNIEVVIPTNEQTDWSVFWGPFFAPHAEPLLKDINVGCPARSTCVSASQQGESKNQAVYNFKQSMYSAEDGAGWSSLGGVLVGVTDWIVGWTSASFAQSSITGGMCIADSGNEICKYLTPFNYFQMKDTCIGGGIVAGIGLLIIVFVVMKLTQPPPGRRF